MNAMAQQKIGNYGLIFGRDSRRESVLDRPTLTSREVDSECLGQGDEVTPGMAITLSKLVDEPINAGSSLGDDLFPFAVPEAYLFI